MAFDPRLQRVIVTMCWPLVATATTVVGSRVPFFTPQAVHGEGGRAGLAQSVGPRLATVFVLRVLG